MTTCPFMMTWVVSDLLLNPGAEFQVGPFGEHCFAIRCWNKDREVSPTGVVSTKNACAVVQCDYRVTKAMSRALNIARDAITPVPSPGEIWRDSLNCVQEQYRQDRARADANHLEALRTPPDVLCDLYEKVTSEMRNATVDFLRVLRWRHVKRFSISVEQLYHPFWRDSQDNQWRRLPAPLPQPDQFLGIEVGMSSPQWFVDEVSKFLQSGRRPSLSFDMVCSARKIATNSPRRSLVEAVQALELGVKETVSCMSPKADWLIAELPSPPISRLIQEYLPRLIESDTTRDAYSHYVGVRHENLKKVVNIRNRIVHSPGSLNVDCEHALMACDVCGDLLYIMDYARGESWAHDVAWSREALNLLYEIKRG
jgi:hypothetical protein